MKRLKPKKVKAPQNKRCMKNSHSIFEFDYLVADPDHVRKVDRAHSISAQAFDWLEQEVDRRAERQEPAYARIRSPKGVRALQVLSHVGVLRTPCGTQIEVLPKIGKQTKGEQGFAGEEESRSRLIEMLCCLREFRHMETRQAQLLAKKMPLWEVFIAEFLRCTAHVVKRGLRSDYVRQEDNLFALRGKLLMAQHLRQNLCRRDRFYTAFDEFSPNRAENRLLHSALQRVRGWAQTPANQRLAQELCFVFADIPTSADIAQDFQKLRLDRGMAHYEPALDWARLILAGQSPLPAQAKQNAISLLFPMEKVFEAFVAKHLRRQLATGYELKEQSSAESLVLHNTKKWFDLKPDLLLQNGKGKNCAVLDTKWKLLNQTSEDSSKRYGNKYGLGQSDFYQLYTYAQYYLEGGTGTVVLIYPKTPSFDAPLPMFEFVKPEGKVKLWVLPFDLEKKKLFLPEVNSKASTDFFDLFGK